MAPAAAGELIPSELYHPWRYKNERFAIRDVGLKREKGLIYQKSCSRCKGVLIL